MPCPNFWSCRHYYCYNLEAEGQGTGHFARPFQPLLPDGQTLGGTYGPSRFSDSEDDGCVFTSRTTGGRAGHVPETRLRSCLWALSNWAI